MKLPNYEVIQELSRNDWYVLYHGRRVADQQPVLLKTPCREAPVAAVVALLGREFEILQDNAVPGVPRAYEWLPHDRGGVLVLEDRGGRPLQEMLSTRPGDLGAFFQFALSLVTIVGELHRRDIVHRNLHPLSIWVDPVTDDVSLLDFSLASQTSGEAPAPLPSHLWSDGLAYMSPEQTGRMNRTVDYRTDFYSLGVVFYEWLTGTRPFRARDRLELMHAHMAKTPPSPAEINPAIPEPLSQIVMKLLVKTAEARYQSAAGLREDLAVCEREWAAHGSIAPFPLGRRDVSDRFLIPQKLYGRDAEVEAMLRAFDRTCAGPTALLLVAGYSGIGKTSLIQELYKPIVRQRGYFIAGKFDQVVRNSPFGALIQAFRGLVQQLLTEGEERLALWRARLAGALGSNGGVLAEVMPEIEWILGRQAPPPPLGPTETQNRFQLVFQNFVGALAQPEHPLVIVLDDLQWADSATLGLFQPLLTNPDIRHLFLIGAYRDNEVDLSHPLMRTLGALEAAGARLHRVVLGPLRLAELTLLVRDTLHGELSDVEPLARMISQKTDGNPFLVIQFLQTLKQEGLLQFDYAQGRWLFHMEAIAAAAITDNVVELMTRKIRRLSLKTQHTLTRAACIGNPFDAATLATVSQRDPEALSADLKEALRERLILPAAAEGGVYTFLHDRVRQAAYAMIPDEQKQQVHLTAGRLLLARWDPATAEEKVFDIAQHLNRGSCLIDDPVERVALARLNLGAGRKAKSSAAYHSALTYLRSGLDLFTDDGWHSDHDLMWDLYIEAAECEYLSGHFDQAESYFHRLLEKARTPLDQAQVHNLRVVQYENMSRYGVAVQCGREGLALFGVTFPDAPEEKQAALETELSRIQTRRAGRAIEALVDLPTMENPEKRMVMKLLTTLWASAYLVGDQMLTRWISATMVRLSLEDGNTEESAYGYVTHAITVGPVMGDYPSAYQWGTLALGVNERFQDLKRRAKVHQQFNAHVNLWCRPLEISIWHAREACRSGLETGDFTYAGYGAFTESWAALLTNRDLERFASDCSASVALLEKIKMSGLVPPQKAILHWARALQGRTSDPLSLSDENFDEQAYRDAYGTHPFSMIFYHVLKLSLCVIFEDYARALEVAQEARGVIRHLSGTIWPVLLDFYYGLTLTALYREATEAQRGSYLSELGAIRDSLAVMAEHCAENFGGFSRLLCAEIDRLSGRDLDAMASYEEAIRQARAAGRISNEALANEFYARFWRTRGNEAIATLYLGEAARLYAQWGATAKVRDLDERYSLARAADAARAAVSPDIDTVTKAAHALAVEIVLEDLLRKLMKIALENAGAQRGFFLQDQGGRLVMAAEGRVDPDEVRVQPAVPLGPSADLARAVVHYVHKTGESIVIDDALADERFSSDPYIAAARPRSILCVPIVHQRQLGGILYLENNLVTNAFTADRIQVMAMLSSQAAISLENARLYEEMKQEAARRRKAEERLRAIVEGTASMTGRDFFRSLARHLAAALQARYAFIAECREKNRARSLAFWSGDGFGENFEFDITSTPCKKVLEGEMCWYARDLQTLFPEDKELGVLGVESYLGIPMRDVSGHVIGHIVVLDNKPMDQDPRGMPVLKIFAARAAAELKRQQAEEELRAALVEVETLKKRLEAENVYLQEELRKEHNFEEMVGNSPALLEVLHKVERVAPTDATVLITGETGTGKELIARAIHHRGTRKESPLVKVNCGAISAGLVESELFGHVKGAFTGALERRVGRFELANGGTLFLDEVGELPLETQVKLLRVLQEGEFEPVGSNRTTRVDVRIIAATNRHLEEAVRAGRFRSDLFYRLNVFPLRVPSLKERRSDVPLLAMFFLARFAKKFGKKVEAISQETMDLLMNYSWPGNVRELQNLIERGVVLSQGAVLTLERELLLALTPGERSALTENTDRIARVASQDTVPSPPRSLATSASHSLEDVERQHILSVLQQTRWVIEGPKGAAKVLNLHPNTLRSRLKKLGIHRATHEKS